MWDPAGVNGLVVSKIRLVNRTYSCWIPDYSLVNGCKKQPTRLSIWNDDETAVYYPKLKLIIGFILPIYEFIFI
jgi:hypothetical protein